MSSLPRPALILPFLGLWSVSAGAQEGKRPATLTVNQTVTVVAPATNDYRAGDLELSPFGAVPPADEPASALTLPRSLLDDQGVRLLSDALKNDASVGEDYAPVGYFQNFEIRGFPLDLATGYKINGLTIAGEQLVPLENKERVEILKGLTGIDAGAASPGGLVNFVTKRPAAVRALTLATDQRGTVYGAADLGHLFGAHQQLGLRTNLGGERIRSYVDDADGYRAFGTLAADWRLSPSTLLRGDFEYQHQVQRSVGGYQLLGGLLVPPLPAPSRLLGEQPWAKPNTFDDVNASVRGEHTFSADWQAFVTAGRSRALLDDNIAYPYGAALDPTQAGSPTQSPLCQPYFFFCPDGSFAVYDFRSPGELRIDDQFEAVLQGHVHTGPVTQDLAVGTSLFRRSVNLSTPVYQWVGNGNIFQPNQTFTPETLATSPVVLADDSHQAALLLNDRVHLPGHIELVIGGQIDRLHDRPIDPGTGLVEASDRLNWLPAYSALVHPVAALTLYGTYSVSLSLGPQAPFWADVNPNAFLPPFFTRSAEVGAKYAAGSRLLLTTALFRMRAPFFYPKLTAAGLDFVSEGHETHRGVEWSAQGRAAPWLNLSTSAAAIEASASDSGTPAIDGKQILNLPHVRATVAADLHLPGRGVRGLRGLAILPGWSYTGRKSATRDDLASVPGYNLFNLGLRYTPPTADGRLTVRLYADNIGDKRYWKDTGASSGDTFLHPGAPTTVRASTEIRF